jgi:Ca-activated chloride channel homolog
MMTMPPRFCPNCSAASVDATDCPRCGFALSGTGSEGRGSCLCSREGAKVPLLGVALSGEVLGAHARLILRQRYKNHEPRPIEAVYTFPIPSDATLVGFAMECEGRRLEAEVKEREEAFQVYDEAIAKGHGAALVEQERPNVFTASLGNLLPGEETVVEVTFLQKLMADEGALRLMVPTLVAPRYIPGALAGDRTGHGTASPTPAVPDADRISPAIGAVRYGLTLDLVFDLGRKVTVESPSHAIHTLDVGGMRTRVSFASPSVALDRDLVLLADGAPGVSAGLVCDKPAGEEGTFALTIVPDLFEAKPRAKGRAVVFVVDVSGSMAGASLEQAKRALRLCLRHLAEGDLFDIVPFSSGFSQLSAQGAFRGGTAPDLLPFSQMTLRQADAFVEALQANGGTEMLAPLSAAARLLAGVRRDRLMILLTDGQVGNEAQILDAITKEAQGARIYTFGIGTNVSDVLLRELSRRTKGAMELIHPGERIDEKVTAQFAKATAARVTDLTVKWVGVDAGEIAPSDPPALVDGEPWSVYGRYEEAGTGRVELRGNLHGEPFFLEVPLALEEGADRPALRSLWAGARVRDLEQVDTSQMGRRAEAHRKRIVDLCVRHRIASRYASFVVVEKRKGDRRAQGMPETRAVPVHAPAGWGIDVKPQSPRGMDRRLGAPAAMLVAGGQRPVARGALAAKPAAMPVAGVARSRIEVTPRGGIDLAAKPAAMPVAGGPPPPPAGASLQEESPICFGIDFNQFDDEDRSADPWPSPPLGAPQAPRSADGKGAPGRVDRAMPPAPLAVTKGAAPEDLGEMFARQLASGLWAGQDSSERGQLEETTACLVRCVREAVDSAHPIYGAQVTKAVEALATLVERLGQSKEGARLARALLAAAAVSGGKRARARLSALAAGAKDGAVAALAGDLSSQDAARKRLG